MPAMLYRAAQGDDVLRKAIMRKIARHFSKDTVRCPASALRVGIRFIGIGSFQAPNGLVFFPSDKCYQILAAVPYRKVLCY